MRMKNVLVGVLAVAGTMASVSAAGAAGVVGTPPMVVAPPVELPATAAGKVAGAFIAMMNEKMDGGAEGFEKAFASATRLGSLAVPERAGRWGKMREEWGRLTVTRVVTSSGGSLTIEVVSERGAGGMPMELEFRMSEAEPGKLDSVVISSHGPAPEAKPMTRGVLMETVEGAANALEEGYVFPDVAKKMAASVRGKLRAGEYDSVKDEAELAGRLTADLRAVSNDKHLRVALRPASSERPDMGPSQRQMEEQNYGFRRVELLEGNIGYVRFDAFVEDERAMKTASAAMAFVAHADAVVFDLRTNGGGSPEMIRYITSYLFDAPTHLNDMIDRDGKVVEEFWTLGSVPGERLAPGTPVYVLTSARTFSGAEEFSYNLKNLKRATIVGETTGGGAHPVRAVRLNDRFVVGVPFMRANNPISKTNWEGTGVEPDVKTSADGALDRALELAREEIKARRK